jgi:photosystem II stability/assembly factor-like uncharacterized protein
MKTTKAALFFLTIVVSCISCKKQTLYFQKVERVESNTTSRLNRIQFLDDTTCIIGGGDKFLKAEILISRDGGHTWQLDSFPQSGKGLYGFGVSRSGGVYLSGFDGTILKTTDKGLNWSEQRIGNWEYHVGISFVNTNKIVFVNTILQRAGSIVITDSNLAIQKTTSYEFGLNDVQMVNDQTGYVVGYGTILKTTDGGDTWTIQDVKGDNFYSIYCIGPDDVWVCGYNGSIQHTIDGGATWNKMRNGNNLTIPKYNLLDIVFKNAATGYAVGEKGLVIYTNDGGETWSRYSSFTENALRSVAICPDGTLLVVGDGGVIYRLHL